MLIAKFKKIFKNLSEEANDDNYESQSMLLPG